MIDSYGEFQSAPKYARSFSVNPNLTTSPLQEIPSLQEVHAKIFMFDLIYFSKFEFLEKSSLISVILKVSDITVGFRAAGCVTS